MSTILENICAKINALNPKPLREGMKRPTSDKVYSRREAADLWGIKTEDVVPRRRKPEKDLWINDLTGETVFAKFSNMNEAEEHPNQTNQKSKNTELYLLEKNSRKLLEFSKKKHISDEEYQKIKKLNSIIYELVR